LDTQGQLQALTLQFELAARSSLSTCWCVRGDFAVALAQVGNAPRPRRCPNSWTGDRRGPATHRRGSRPWARYAAHWNLP
jgi:hypothetical protein